MMYRRVEKSAASDRYIISSTVQINFPLISTWSNPLQFTPKNRIYLLRSLTFIVLFCLILTWPWSRVILSINLILFKIPFPYPLILDYQEHIFRVFYSSWNNATFALSLSADDGARQVQERQEDSFLFPVSLLQWQNIVLLLLVNTLIARNWVSQVSIGWWFYLLSFKVRNI